MLATMRRFEPRKNMPLVFLVGMMVPITIFLLVQLAKAPVAFIQTLMKALALGSVYAIVALGFVLIFKATRTINFARSLSPLCSAS